MFFIISFSGLNEHATTVALCAYDAEEAIAACVAKISSR